MLRTFHNRMYTIPNSHCYSLNFDIELNKRASRGKFTFSCYLFQNSEKEAFEKEGFSVFLFSKKFTFPAYYIISWQLAMVSNMETISPLSYAQQLWLKSDSALCKKIG